MLSFLLISTAHAVIFGGNPELTIWAERDPADLTDGAVTLDKVRMDLCNGSPVDYEVDEQIDLIAGYTLAIDDGNYCGATFFWSSDMTLQGSTGNGWGIEYTQNATYVPISTMTKALTPYTVIYGVVYGGNPGLKMAIE